MTFVLLSTTGALAKAKRQNVRTVAQVALVKWILRFVCVEDERLPPHPCYPRPPRRRRSFTHKSRPRVRGTRRLGFHCAQGLRVRVSRIRVAVASQRSFMRIDHSTPLPVDALASRRSRVDGVLACVNVTARGSGGCVYDGRNHGEPGAYVEYPMTATWRDCDTTVRLDGIQLQPYSYLYHVLHVLHFGGESIFAGHAPTHGGQPLSVGVRDWFGATGLARQCQVWCASVV